MVCFNAVDLRIWGGAGQENGANMLIKPHVSVCYNIDDRK